MYILDAAIARFSASDVANFLACHHLLTLDIEHGAGHIERPFFRGPSIEFLRGQARALVPSSLNGMSGLDIVEIPTDLPRGKAIALTVDALHRGLNRDLQVKF